MWQGFIGTEIQRTNRNLLLANLGMVGIPIAIGVFGWSYWGSFFGGAKLVSNQDLISAPSNYIGRYVKVIGSAHMETGMQEISQRKSKYTGEVKSETVTARIIALKLSGDQPNSERAIFVKLQNEAPANNFATGKIESMSTFLEQEIQSSPERDSILPVTLDTASNFHLPGYFSLAIGLTGGIIGAINLAKWKQRQNNHQLHPIVKQLGNYGDAAYLSQQIEQELNRPSVIVHKETKISDNWMFQKSSFGLEIKKMVDIIWIYFQVTSHRTNGIPTGKTYTTICFDRNGGKVEIPGSEAQVMELAAQIHARVPWAMIGYSDEIKLAWEQDRVNLIAYVDDAHQEFKADSNSSKAEDLHANN